VEALRRAEAIALAMNANRVRGRWLYPYVSSGAVQGKVIEFWRSSFDKLSRCSARRRSRRPIRQPAWALIAARLGNQKNRRDFVNAVWWTEQRKGDDDRPPPPPGLRDLLTAWETHPEKASWAEAVEAFERARDRAAAIRDDRLRTRAALDRLTELESELETAREAERTARERVAASRPRRDQLDGALRSQEEERRRRIQAHEDARQRRPWILRLRARAEWRAHDRRLAADIAAIDTLLRETTDEVRALDEEMRADAEATAVVAAVEGALDEGPHRVVPGGGPDAQSIPRPCREADARKSRRCDGHRLR
jgi:hypothetical protein